MLTQLAKQTYSRKPRHSSYSNQSLKGQTSKRTWTPPARAFPQPSADARKARKAQGQLQETSVLLANAFEVSVFLLRLLRCQPLAWYCVMHRVRSLLLLLLTVFPPFLFPLLFFILAMLHRCYGTLVIDETTAKRFL